MKSGGNPLEKKHEDSPSHMKHEIPIIFDDQRVFPVFRRARPPREERVQWLRLKLNLFESEGKNLENVLICPSILNALKKPESSLQEKSRNAIPCSLNALNASRNHDFIWMKPNLETFLNGRV